MPSSRPQQGLIYSPLGLVLFIIALVVLSQAKKPSCPDGTNCPVKALSMAPAVALPRGVTEGVVLELPPELRTRNPSQKSYRFDALFLDAPGIYSGCGGGRTTYCVFSLSNSSQVNPISCDPFYYDHVHTIQFLTGIAGVNCGTATVRVTITE